MIVCFIYNITYLSKQIKVISKGQNHNLTEFSAYRLQFRRSMNPTLLIENADLQTQLAKFNHVRLAPTRPTDNWKDEIRDEIAIRIAEGDMLERKRREIAEWVSEVPNDADQFVSWFESLKDSGPGQHDPLFPWLAEEASAEQMTWFIQQEVAGEAGFDDLVALTQVKLPTQAKLELARNYWDEMGRGNEKGMHGPMLGVLAQELGIEMKGYREIVPESLALGNLMMGLAVNRRYTYHSIGALGVIELTAPDRAKCVYQGLKRLGVSPAGQRYYLLHSTLDVQHSLAWNKEALYPLVKQDPSVALSIAEGAFMRLNAGAKCFEKYREHLWNGRRVDVATTGARSHVQVA